jgi:hypothetical protein
LVIMKAAPPRSNGGLRVERIRRGPYHKFDAW